jgi:hypothetical protein
MRELNARLRVAGLTDAESRQLPTRVDATSLHQMELSTWRTDAGDFDVLADLPDRTGRHRRYEELAPRSVTMDAGGLSIRVAALDDVIASKEWADRPKDHEALPELRTLNEALTEKGLSERAREIMRSDQSHREPPDAGLSL